jgi:signal transduction histidine kinase
VFRQGYTSKPSDEEGGRGFGLALTRLVCRRRGGEVSLRNRSEGGAEFTARLPLTAPEQGTLRDPEAARS